MLHLRAYQPDNQDALIALWHLCNLVRPQNDPARDIARKLAHDADGLIVAMLDDTLIGSIMAGYEGRRGWLNLLAVHPSHQRLGIGRALVTHAEHWLQQQGCPKANLQIRETNAAVIGFYEACGYQRDPVISMGKRFTG